MLASKTRGVPKSRQPPGGDRARGAADRARHTGDRQQQGELNRAIGEVANLFKVRTRNEFRRQLSGAIDVMNFSHQVVSNISSNIKSVVTDNDADFLNRITAAAAKLDSIFADMQDALSGSGERSTAALRVATLLLVMEHLSLEAGGTDPPHVEPAAWVADYRRRMAALTLNMSLMLPELTGRRRGRPPGEFTLFIRRLREITWSNGGRWTFTRVPHTLEPEWKGTLVTAVEALRPLLPPTDFFPPGNLGHALARILDALPKR